MKTLILDGNNIIRRNENLQRNYTQTGCWNYEQENILSNKLLKFLSIFKEDGWKIEAYFDGPKRSIWHEDDLVDVFFSKYKKADDLIVNNVADLTENYSQQVMVVTQDRELQKRCAAYGATILRASDFLDQTENYRNYCEIG